MTFDSGVPVAGVTSSLAEILPTPSPSTEPLGTTKSCHKSSAPENFPIPINTARQRRLQTFKTGSMLIRQLHNVYIQWIDCSDHRHDFIATNTGEGSHVKDAKSSGVLQNQRVSARPLLERFNRNTSPGILWGSQYLPLAHVWNRLPHLDVTPDVGPVGLSVSPTCHCWHTLINSRLESRLLTRREAHKLLYALTGLSLPPGTEPPGLTIMIERFTTSKRPFRHVVLQQRFNGSRHKSVR